MDWQEIINYQFGFSSPQEPRRAQNYKIELHQPSEVKEVKKKIHHYVERQIENGKYKDRDDLIEDLKSKDFEITRVGEKYISVKHSKINRAIRLKGLFYERQKYSRSGRKSNSRQLEWEQNRDDEQKIIRKRFKKHRNSRKDFLQKRLERRSYGGNGCTKDSFRECEYARGEYGELISIFRKDIKYRRKAIIIEDDIRDSRGECRGDLKKDFRDERYHSGNERCVERSEKKLYGGLNQCERGNKSNQFDHGGKERKADESHGKTKQERSFDVRKWERKNKEEVSNDKFYESRYDSNNSNLYFLGSSVLGSYKSATVESSISSSKNEPCSYNQIRNRPRKGALDGSEGEGLNLGKAVVGDYRKRYSTYNELGQGVGRRTSFFEKLSRKVKSRTGSFKKLSQGYFNRNFRSTHFEEELRTILSIIRLINEAVRRKAMLAKLVEREKRLTIKSSIKQLEKDRRKPLYEKKRRLRKR